MNGRCVCDKQGCAVLLYEFGKDQSPAGVHDKCVIKHSIITC